LRVAVRRWRQRSKWTVAAEKAKVSSIAQITLRRTCTSDSRCSGKRPAARLLELTNIHIIPVEVVNARAARLQSDESTPERRRIPPSLNPAPSM